MRRSHVISLILGSFCLTSLALAADTKTTAPAAKPSVVPAPVQAAPAPAAQPAQIPAEPTVTSAAYGAWTLRCVRSPSGDQTIKTCEVLLEARVEGQARPAAILAVGRLPNETDLRVTALTPNNISIPGAIRVAIAGAAADAEETAVVTLRWSRCLESGCFADNKPGADALKAWRAGSAGRLTFMDAAGRLIAVPLSWVGLDQALNALAKE